MPSHDNPQTIDEWHKARGWDGIGYHYYIDKQGTIFRGRQDWVIGAGVYGKNSHSLHICLGGLNNFSFPQGLAMYQKVLELKAEYPLAQVAAHNRFDKKKLCPNFDNIFLFGGLNGYSIEQKTAKDDGRITKETSKISN